ncbi:MAG: cysteine peptidase family C39 domain-containing protein [Leptonema sp. (in: bacteria)]
MKKLKDFSIKNQPDETTCGITCLQSIYRYYEEKYPSLQQLKEEVEFLKEGGTLAGMLGNHALQRRYRISIYTYNLQIFDPAWFIKRNIKYKKKN